MSVFNNTIKLENNLILNKWIKKIKKKSYLFKLDNDLIKSGYIISLRINYKLNDEIFKEILTGLCLSFNNYKMKFQASIKEIFQDTMNIQLKPIKNYHWFYMHAQLVRDYF